MAQEVPPEPPDCCLPPSPPRPPVRLERVLEERVLEFEEER